MVFKYHWYESSSVPRRTERSQPRPAAGRGPPGVPGAGLLRRDPGPDRRRGGLLQQAQAEERGTPGWRLLVTEFRLHAARDPELNRRYAALHARTRDGVAQMFAEISKENAGGLPFPPRQLAELWLAIDTGRALEQIADPHALDGLDLHRLADYFAGQQMPAQEER